MNIFSINISFRQLRLIIFSFISFLIFSIIIWIFTSYYIYKWLKMKIDEDYFYFNEYSQSCKKILDIYGNYNIKRMYLVRQPITKFAKTLLNIITLYKFEKEMKQYMKTSNKKLFLPRHTSIIIEIELPNKHRKKILIEKNNCIKLTLDFQNSHTQDIRKIKLNKTYTLNSLLTKTQKRVGDNNFFNWSITKNNCQIFAQELLKSINQYNNTNKNFISQSDFIKKIKCPEFSLHIIHSIINIYNILESMIGKSIYF